MKITDSQWRLLDTVLWSAESRQPGYIETGRFKAFANVTVNSLVRAGWIAAESRVSNRGGSVGVWLCRMAPGKGDAFRMEIWDQDRGRVVVDRVDMTFDQANRWNALFEGRGDPRRIIPRSFVGAEDHSAMIAKVARRVGL